MADVHEIELSAEAEGAFVKALKDLLRRLDAAEKIILALANIERREYVCLGPGHFIKYRNLARNYVEQEMTHQAGVKKAIKSWKSPAPLAGKSGGR